MEGVQAQLRYAQLRVQSLEQEMKSIKQDLEQKVSSSSRDEIPKHVFLVLEKRKHRTDEYLWWTLSNEQKMTFLWRNKNEPVWISLSCPNASVRPVIIFFYAVFCDI